MRTLNIKKSIAFLIAIVMICIAFGVVAWHGNQSNIPNKAFAANDEQILTLQIGNPNMTVNGTQQEIDPGMGTVPVVQNDRTLLPVRAVIEAVDGTVSWEETTQTAILTYNDDIVRLTIGSQTAYLNDTLKTLDVEPVIINDRTMLPIRFIAESFGFNVDWTQETQTVTITVPAADASSTAPSLTTSESTVYMTTDITPEALVKVYEQLGFTPEGKVAIKISTGEPPASNYLDPNLIKDLVQSVDGTIVECNTAYGGQRSETALHKQVAADHGFTAIADVDIMDENGSLSIPVIGGSNLTENFVGANLANYDSMITISHFKGHAMGGFGGAIKNMSIGIASREGKSWIHTAGNSKDSPWGGDQDKFLESMAEANKSVVDYMDGKIVYVSVMNNLSIDCDCDGNPAEPDMHDVGILASTDPVALDQACVDIVYNTDRAESGSLIERIESRNGLHTLEHAEKIGLGNRAYNLISIDS